MPSRKMSLIEAITNNIVAFGISVVLSLYGLNKGIPDFYEQG